MPRAARYCEHRQQLRPELRLGAAVHVAAASERPSRRTGSRGSARPSKLSNQRSTGRAKRAAAIPPTAARVRRLRPGQRPPSAVSSGGRDRDRDAAARGNAGGRRRRPAAPRPARRRPQLGVAVPIDDPGAARAGVAGATCSTSASSGDRSRACAATQQRQARVLRAEVAGAEHRCRRPAAPAGEDRLPVCGVRCSSVPARRGSTRNRSWSNGRFERRDAGCRPRTSRRPRSRRPAAPAHAGPAVEADERDVEVGAVAARVGEGEGPAVGRDAPARGSPSGSSVRASRRRRDRARRARAARCRPRRERRASAARPARAAPP